MKRNMAAEQDSHTDYENTKVAESLISSGDYGRPSFQENNGHFSSSPEEDSFTPTSVIYFKEALTSASVQFGKKGLSPPARVKYEFHIETTKKTKSECVYKYTVYRKYIVGVCCARASNVDVSS